MTKKFSEILHKYQTGINAELKFFFSEEIKKSNSPFFIKTLKILKEFSLRPGKKIRAILVNHGYLLLGGKDKKNILKASIFIELIHNFLLIHDDILDKEEMRRGKPSLHRLYQKETKLKDKKEKEYYGLSMSVVAGDMMEFLARKILSESKFSAECKTNAIKKLNQILISTAHGEMFEYWLRKNREIKKITEKDILEIYKNKTAYYTFIGPLQIGAILAGAPEKSLLLLEKIGLPLGIAFQIEDDIEEIFGDKKTIGSKLGSDIQENQPNLLILKTIKNKKGEILNKFLGKKNITGRDLKIIKNAIIKSGAYEDCQQIAKNLINQAKKDIIHGNYPQKEKEFLINLADYILARKD